MRLLQRYILIGSCAACLFLAGCSQQAPIEKVSRQEIHRLDYVYYIPDAEIPIMEVQALNGSPEAAERLLFFYFNWNFDRIQGRYWEEIAAENGASVSQDILAHELRMDFTEPRSRERYSFWLEKPSANGHGKLTKAECNLFEASSEDQLHALSDADIEKLQQQALIGAPEPALRLHFFYDRIRQDPNESRFWARISAQNGDPVGQCTFGVILNREPDPKSRLRAKFWLKRAAESGNLHALKLLMHLQ